jgi:type II secretory pathway predicted ATPase ExeA
MYEQNFGFSSPLFADGMARDESVFRTQAVLQLVRDLEIALVRKDAVAVLSGVSGTGKTTIAADALKSINTRLAFTCISHPPLTGHELLEQLLTDFGFEPYRKSRVERLQLWRQFLSEMAATDTRVCLLVESIEDLSPEVMQALHTLTAADATLSPGANIVFTTSQAPERLLTTHDMLAINQRVRLRQRIEPLTEDETRDYLAFKCRNANASVDQAFEPGVAARLFELSGGIFRVIENLLESTLMSAAAANERTVTVDRLVHIADRQFGISRLPPEEVDALLGEQSEEQESPESAVASAPESQGTVLPQSLLDQIPTLTDFVIPRNEDRQPVSVLPGASRSAGDARTGSSVNRASARR